VHWTDEPINSSEMPALKPWQHKLLLEHVEETNQPVQDFNLLHACNSEPRIFGVASTELRCLYQYRFKYLKSPSMKDAFTFSKSTAKTLLQQRKGSSLKPQTQLLDSSPSTRQQTQAPLSLRSQTARAQSTTQARTRSSSQRRRSIARRHRLLQHA
jgi:hypothetical protein